MFSFRKRWNYWNFGLGSSVVSDFFHFVHFFLSSGWALAAARPTQNKILKKKEEKPIPDLMSDRADYYQVINLQNFTIYFVLLPETDIIEWSEWFEENEELLDQD